MTAPRPSVQAAIDDLEHIRRWTYRPFYLSMEEWLKRNKERRRAVSILRAYERGRKESK